MPLITLPAVLKIADMTWGQRRMDMEFRSPFGAQAMEISGALWEVNLRAAVQSEIDSGAWKAFLMLLRGRTNQVALYDLLRPVPLGTMRGAMTLSIAAAQGATSLNIVAAGQNNLTLLQGDMLGFGAGATQQVVMVVVDAISNGTGNIVVTVEPPVRNAQLIAAAVTWDKPTALFRRMESKSIWKYSQGKKVEGFDLSLLEDPRP